MGSTYCTFLIKPIPWPPEVHQVHYDASLLRNRTTGHESRHNSDRTPRPSNQWRVRLPATAFSDGITSSKLFYMDATLHGNQLKEKTVC
jgi:hypothetical protein